MRKNSAILLIVKSYALALSVFFIFRLILFFTEIDRINLQEDKIITILKAFFMGLRFDIVISGYILLFPALLLITVDVLKKGIKYVHRFVFYWIFIFFSIAFAICSADIPYFNQFFSRFSIGAFDWMDNAGFVFSMIISEPRYFLVVIPLLVFIFLFYKVLIRIFNRKTEQTPMNLTLKITLSIVLLLLMLIGIRGRIEKKSPIRIGTAYFSNNAFLNQLGLNPVFTLMRSYLNSKNKNNKILHLIDNQLAIKNVQNQLGIVLPKYKSPIARKVSVDTSRVGRPNVILIIMESMSSAKMNRHGNDNNLTPFLDSLSYQSYYFENIYTAGKHTFNGVFSTLFSFPALYRQHPLKTIKKYNGLSSVLHNNGYSTSYFTTHDSQFDNIAGFLRANDFDNIISQSDYPKEAIENTLGVPDDFMFEFSIPIIDKMHQDGNPFFVTFMTASDHGPYYIPPYFTPKNTEIKKQIVEYADWSLNKFLLLSSEKDWYSNTIFVFIADHGSPITAIYDISLDYHHSPLIIFAPELLGKPKLFDCIGGQIDVFPTLMGLLGFSYVNNTLGVDLIHEKRPYTIINDDDKLGVLDNEFLLIYKGDDDLKLFKYRSGDRNNYINDYPKKAEEMLIYLKSNMQLFQYLLINNKQFVGLDAN